MTQNRRLSLFSVLFVFLLSFLPASGARADSAFGDSAVTVGLATVAGAVMGASTLPFYEESGEHTKNIFYGAAIGAVIGVFISAYSGVKDGPGFDDARLKPTPPSAVSLNEAPELRLKVERSSAQLRPASFADGSILAWSPVANFRF